MAAFSYDNFDKLSAEGHTNVRRLWSYIDLSITIATLSASGYFNDASNKLKVGDSILLRGSDGIADVYVTALTPNVTVAVNSGILPGAVTNTEVSNSAAIAYSKLAALPTGSILVGNAGVPTAAALSGALTVGATGVATLANNGVASAQTAANLIQYAAVPITAAQWNGMYAAPKLLVAAGGANTLIVVKQLALLLTYNSAAFAAGGVVFAQYDSTANGAGAKATVTEAAADFFATASTGYELDGNMGTGVPFATSVNKGLYLSNATGAFTTGNSTLVAHVWYSIVPTV